MRAECSFCGDKNCKAFHSKKAEDCKAYGKTCTKCGKKNHFASVCRSSNEKGFAKSKANVATAQTEESVETKNSSGSF